MTDIKDIDQDIVACHLEVRRLQAETVHCIAFKPTGKIEVVDKARLEELNTRVEELGELAAHNSEVLGRLQAVVAKEGTFRELDERQRRTQDAIRKYESIFRQDLARLLQDNPTVDPTDPLSHSRVQDLKRRVDEQLDILRPQFEEYTKRLAEARAILQEYKPSGLPAPSADEYRHSISRESVAAFGR